ncbi:MAG TPA: hypothetical protein VGL92_17355, partial [Acidimicrobiia bacterium]
MADRAFDPAALFEVLAGHAVDYVVIGGMAATLHGSVHVTFDVDITPKRDPDNLQRLAEALEELEARLRVPNEPEGVGFAHSAAFLARCQILTLTTRFGDLDISFVPSGTDGYPDLRRDAVELTIHGTRIMVAALADVVRSKEAAGREKDRLVLPELRALLGRQMGGG